MKRRDKNNLKPLSDINTLADSDDIVKLDINNLEKEYINRLFINGFKYGWTDLQIVKTILCACGLNPTIEICMDFNQKYNPLLK
jgi:hypothetical protein